VTDVYVPKFTHHSRQLIHNSHSFLALSAILEGVGTSAYLGGAPLITSKDILNVAASITAVEAGHTAQQRAAVKQIAVPNPLGTVRPSFPRPFPSQAH